MHCSRISLTQITQPESAVWGFQIPEHSKFDVHASAIDGCWDTPGKDPYLLPPCDFFFFFGVCSLTCPQGRFAHVYLFPFFAEKNAHADMQLASGEMAWSHWVRPESQGRLSYFAFWCSPPFHPSEPLETMRGFSHLNQVVWP